jgi:CheY-like chemotaxis protein
MAKVLVIGDDPNGRDSICRILTGGGHETLEAATGKDVIEAVGHTRFDLVICDIRMPAQGGIQTLQQIRKLDPGRPIIAIYGASGVIPLLAGSMGERDRVILKPFMAEQLLTAVDGMLDRHSV